jgi:hypothetical protein
VSASRRSFWNVHDKGAGLDNTRFLHPTTRRNAASSRMHQGLTMPERIDRLIICGLSSKTPLCSEEVARENAVACAERLELVWRLLTTDGLTVPEIRKAVERGIESPKPDPVESSWLSSDPRTCRCWYSGWGNDIKYGLFTCRHCGSKAVLVDGRWQRLPTPPPAATPPLPTPASSGPTPAPEHPTTHTPDPEP